MNFVAILCIIVVILTYTAFFLIQYLRVKRYKPLPLDTDGVLRDRVFFSNLNQRAMYRGGATLSLEDTNLILRDKNDTQIFRFPITEVTIKYASNSIDIHHDTEKYNVKIDEINPFRAIRLLSRYEIWSNSIHDKGGASFLKNRT